MSARKKDRSKNKRVKSGLGVGKSKEIEVAVDRLKENSRCDGCNDVFALLQESDQGKLCMKCYSTKYGSTQTFEVMKRYSTEEVDLWENPVTQTDIDEQILRKRYSDEKLNRQLAEIMTIIISETATFLIHQSCKENECNDKLSPCVLEFDKDAVDEILRISGEDVTKAVVKDDPLLQKYMIDAVLREVKEFGEPAYHYLYYLTNIFSHFKHTCKGKSHIGTFSNNVRIDIENLKHIDCTYRENELDHKKQIKLLHICKDILGHPDNFTNRKHDIKTFIPRFIEGVAQQKINEMIYKYHVEEKHGVFDVTKHDVDYLKANKYPIKFDKMEEENLSVGLCDKCHLIIPFNKQEYISETQLKAEKLEQTMTTTEHKQKEKAEKINKEKPVFLSVNDTIKKLIRLGIKSQSSLKKAKKKGYCKDIPSNPVMYYSGAFKWSDIRKEKVRSKEPKITMDKVEQAIRMLKSNWNLYMRKPEGFFYDWFDSWGLFDAKDPYKQRFFTEFINLKQTVEGRRELFEALSQNRFDMKFGHYPRGKSIPSSSALTPQLEKTQQVTNQVDEIDIENLLADDKEAGVHLILKETDTLLPMDPTSRAFTLHLNITVQEIWLSVIKNGKSERNKVYNWKKNAKSLLTKRTINQFLDEYAQVHQLWDGLVYSEYRGKPPNEMQMYVAFKIKQMNGYCNFSSTGTGKTKSATIATRITKSRNNLILCPNSIKPQWSDMIKADYPLSYTSISDSPTDEIFPPAKHDDAYRYHIINYEKFGITETVEKLLDTICETRVDMIIIDEAQWVKQRDDQLISNRRRNLQRLIDRLRIKNPKLKVMFMTATPIINNLTEGIRLLEMVANKRFPHLKTTNQIRNASRLYMEFLQYALRYKKVYKVAENHHKITTQSYIPTRFSADEVRKFNYSDWEILCTPDRIPEMIKIVKQKGRAIIYTEYVTVVVDKIKEAFEKEGFKVGLYTGENKEGLIKKTEMRGEKTNPFINGDIDVLVASSPISEGIDGLQKVCNTLIFNGLTWTYAKYEQIIGRLVRTGQTSDVDVYTIMSKIESYEFDQKIKLDRLYQKEMLQMCVLDGKIPDIKAWNKKSTNVTQEFIETVLRDQKSRIKSKKEIRDSGVKET